MSPRLAANDIANIGLRYSEFDSQLVLVSESLGVLGSNEANLLTRQLALSASFLRSHICHVGRVVSQEQMGDLNAGSYVAVVQDVGSLGNRAIVQFPSEAMGSVETPANVQFAVAVVEDGASPKTAATLVGGSYMLPKAVSQRGARSNAPAVFAAKLPAAALQDAMLDAKLTAALPALDESATVVAHRGSSLRGAIPPDCANSRGGFLVPSLYHVGEAH